MIRCDELSYLLRIRPQDDVIYQRIGSVCEVSAQQLQLAFRLHPLSHILYRLDILLPSVSSARMYQTRVLLRRRVCELNNLLLSGLQIRLRCVAREILVLGKDDLVAGRLVLFQFNEFCGRDDQLSNGFLFLLLLRTLSVRRSLGEFEHDRLPESCLPVVLLAHH